MRGARRITIGILLLLAALTPANAVEPDDTPWSLRGTDAAGKPLTIEDLLARDQMSIIEDTDIPPPGQDQRDLQDNQNGESFEQDRLAPKLPAEVHDAPARAPDTALNPVESAPLAPTLSMRRGDPVEAKQPPATSAIQSRGPASQPSAAPTLKPEPIAPVASPRRAVSPVAPIAQPPANVTSPQTVPQTVQLPAGPATTTANAPQTVPPSTQAPAGLPSTTANAPQPARAPGSPPTATANAPQTAPQTVQVPAGPSAATTTANAPQAAQSAAQPPVAARAGDSVVGRLQPTQAMPAAPSGQTVPATRPTQQASPQGTPNNAPAQSAGLPSSVPQSPTPPAITTAPPAQAAIATDGQEQTAPPPLAVPSEPVAQATVAANGKLYLPLKRYFETKAAVTLADYDGADRTALLEYYEKTVGEAMWVDKDGYNTAATSLIDEINKADDWGLSSNDYRIPPLSRAKGENYDYELLADAEVKLSLVAMTYARHARGDRIENPTEQLASYIDRKPQLIERPKLLEALSTATDKGAYLRSLHPKHPQFQKLRELLIRVHSAQANGNEPEPIPDGPKILPGKTHWQVALLRRRLGLAEPPQKADGTPASEEFFDDALANAVVAYKEKNDLSPANPALTNELRRSLNQNTKIGEETILANMEAWRWMPEDLGETYIWVNIPEFLVRVKKHEEIIHEERVITGRVETQTPIFSNKMRTVVFQPSWNVPESIKVNELLPKLRAGDNPIASQGLRLERNGHDVDVWDVDWNAQDIREYHIFQPPGDANVLGIVKFLFPNKHSVYLHDTPTKRLFNEKIRTFSHGCMRVRNPVKLAEVIMAEDKGWDKEKVNEMITTGPEDNDIALDRPIPVHVVYFTLWVDDNGQPKTFPDVYGHEKRIKLGLNGRWSEIDKPRDHLLPPEDPGTVASNREDWGDEDSDTPRRRRANQLRYGDDPPPRQAYRAPPPGYKQVYPKKSGSAISEIFNNIFGNN